MNIEDKKSKMAGSTISEGNFTVAREKNMTIEQIVVGSSTVKQQDPVNNLIN